jgi:hypothetical protein
MVFPKNNLTDCLNVAGMAALAERAVVAVGTA